MRQRLARLRLRFPDPTLESAFREDRFHLNLGKVRLAFLAGIGLWIGWGLLLRSYMLALQNLRLDANAVSAALTTERVTTLVGKVVMGGQDVARVARDFLVANDLL